MIRQYAAAGKPFFVHMCYTAPRDPLQWARADSPVALIDVSPASPRYLETVHGVGVKLVDPT